MTSDIMQFNMVLCRIGARTSAIEQQLGIVDNVEPELKIDRTVDRNQ